MTSYAPLYEKNKDKVMSKDLDISITKTPFLFLQEHKVDYKNMTKLGVKTINVETTLSNLFFSKKNMDNLQTLIKKEIYNVSKGKFILKVNQDENDLLLNMRAVFLQRSTNQPFGLKEQLTELNTIVVNEVIPDMITAIKQEIGYLKDISTPLTPLDRPINESSAGRKTALPALTSSMFKS